MTNLFITVLLLIVAAAVYNSFFPFQPPAHTIPYVQSETYNAQSPAASTHKLAGCIANASLIYDIPADVMFGIMKIEGGRIGQSVDPNVNGTYDIGPMQINSLWVGPLAELWGLGRLSTFVALRDNGCVNIYVGAWILKQKIVETGSLYRGIAAYHSSTARLGSTYANKVIAAMDRMPPL